MPYLGVIIEESLANKDILKDVKILSTKISKVTAKHHTPWLSQWTLHTVEVPENEALEIAKKISQSIDHNHSGSWYADFKDDTHHYIIFPGKIFYIDRTKKEEYAEAAKYGLALGIPAHQLDFSPEII